MTQYGYGYGYQQPYGYGQVATTPTVGYTSYQQQQQRMPYSGTTQTPQPAQQATATQPPSVGYSPYTPNSAAGSAHQHQQQHHQQQQARPAQPPTQQYHAPQHQQQKATPTIPPHGTSQVSASPSYYSTAQQTAQAHAHQQQQQHQQHAQAHQAQQAATTGYYGYGTAYRAQATSYSPYYGQQQQQQQQRQATQQSQSSPVQQSSMRAASSGGGGGGGGMATSHYTSPAQTRTGGASAAAASSGSSMVTYPAYTPTNYYSAYNKQTNQKTGTSATSLTSQQQHVVASYIQQKTKGAQQNFFTKRTPVDPAQYYCEVCKISCACAATYKTHLEGKNHKKRLQQQQNVSKEIKGGENYCELCDVVCSNRDAFEAHVRGSKHQKVLTLHRRLGKPIPQINVPSTTGTQTTTGGKTVMVAAPRITFVGGQQLHSTGQTGSTNQQAIKVYPPGPAVTSATPTKPDATAPAQQKTATTPTTQVTATPTSQQTTPTPQQSTPVQEQDTSATTPQDDAAVEPVGEQFVVSVKGDPKVPHATYKCELCDCYFNDDYAKKMHVKGRRHRLNYKKAYQPDLYIEPTKAQKKELEKKRLKRMSRNSTDGYPGPQGGGAGPAQSQASLNELRRQEAIELAKRRKQQMMSEDFSRGSGGGSPLIPPLFSQDGPPPAPMFPPDEGHGWHGDFGPPMHMFPPAPPRPHNPHDDKLVLSKHGSIYPLESELKAVEAVVADIEKALKQLSDDLLTEQCKVDGSTEVKKDESLRELRGAYRVGSHAIGLMLRGECSVELVLMCANKPTHKLFNEVATRLPAKFENFSKANETENIYNITPELQKASLIIISQVGDHRIQVTVTLTSKQMREEPAAVEEGATEETVPDSEAGVLDRVPCLAALAALRHTTWFKTTASILPSCAIVLRVLKDICHRVPAWGVLDSWMIELLVPKCITSANPDFTKPGDVFRRVMECVASGLFLPGGSGLKDPCETGVVDASAKLTAQERANITLSAQHALRLIAFGKLHLVLGVNPLAPHGTPRQRPTSKESESPSKDVTDTSGGGDDVAPSVGVKRDSADDMEGAEAVKKIKLES